MMTFLERSPPHLLNAAASSGLNPPPAGRVRRAVQPPSSAQLRRPDSVCVRDTPQRPISVGLCPVRNFIQLDIGHKRHKLMQEAAVVNATLKITTLDSYVQRLLLKHLS